MATLDVYNLSGDVTGSVEIDTDKLPSINKHLLQDVVQDGVRWKNAVKHFNFQN